MSWLDRMPPPPEQKSSWLDRMPPPPDEGLTDEEKRRKRLAEISRENAAHLFDQSDPLLKSKMDKKYWSLGENVAIGEQQAGELKIGADSEPLAYLGSALKEYSGGPVVGVAEAMNLVPEGSRAKIRANWNTERERFLSANPSTGGAIASAVMDVAGAGPLVATPGVIGKVAAMGAKAIGAGSALTKLAGAFGGAAENAALAYGDVIDKSDAEKALSTGLGAGLGYVGGRSVGKAVAAKEVSRVPFWTRMFDNNRGQPKEVYSLKNSAKGAVAEVDSKLGFSADRLKASIRETTGLFDGKERKELEGLINKALRGDEEAMRILPEHVQGPVSELRAHQDAASHALVTNMLSGEENAMLLTSAVSKGMNGEHIAKIIRANSADELAKVLVELPNNLSPRALDDVLELSKRVDSMEPWRKETARRFIGDAAKIDFNMGEYVNRSYMGYIDPTYAKELRKQGMQSWRYADFVEMYQKEMGKSEEEAHSAAKGLISQMENLFTNPRPNSLRGGSVLPPINLDALKPRGEISSWVQNLLGLIEDPIESVRTGTLKAATMAHWGEAMNSLLDDGVKRGMFEIIPDALGSTPRNPRLNATLGNSSRFNLPEGYVVKTTPEINAALTLAEKVSEDNWFHAINAIFNANLTKGSIGTSSRNVISNPAIIAMSGHPLAGGKEYARAMKDIANLEIVRETGGIPVFTREAEEELSGWAKRLILESGGAMGDVRHGMGKIKNPGGLLAKGSAKFVGAPSTARKATEVGKAVLRKGDDLTSAAYHTPDEGARLAVARSITKRLADIFGTTKTLDEIKDMAAERTLKKMPTPSQTYPIVNTLRKNVPVGPFAMFPAEILRSTINNIEIAVGDIRMGRAIGNQKLFWYGWQQMGSVVGTLAGMASIPTGIRMVANKAIPYIQKGGKERNAEIEAKEKAALHMVPSFYENSQISLLPTDDPDKIRYLDFGGLNPFGILFKPAAAMMNSMEANDGVFEASLAAMKEFVEPFLSAKIPVQAGVEIYGNAKTSGGPGPGTPIRNESDTKYEQAKDVAKYLGRSGAIPKAFAQVKDLWNNPSQDQLLKTFGITIREERVSTLMSKRSKFQYAKEYKGVRRIATEISGPAKRGHQRPDPTALHEAEARANQQWIERGYKPILQDIEAMRTWGKSNAEIKKILFEDTGLPEYVIDGALRGIPVVLRF